MDSNSSIPSAYSAFSNPGERRHSTRGHLRAQDLALAKDSRRVPEDDHRKNRSRNNRLKRHQTHRSGTLTHGTDLQDRRMAPQRRSPMPAKLDEHTCVPLHHGQLLDALFRLACNRPRNFTIGAVGSLRFKRRDNAITQHIDAHFSRPATQSH